MKNGSKGCLILILLIVVASTGGKVLLPIFVLVLAAALTLLLIPLLMLLGTAVKAGAAFAFPYLPGAFLILDKRHQKEEAKLRNSPNDCDQAAVVQRMTFLDDHRERLSKAKELTSEELNNDFRILGMANSKMQQVIDKASELNSKKSQLTSRCQSCGKRIYFHAEDYGKTVLCPNNKCSSVIPLE